MAQVGTGAERNCRDSGGQLKNDQFAAAENDRTSAATELIVRNSTAAPSG
jgi:hypothetical protein